MMKNGILDTIKQVFSQCSHKKRPVIIEYDSEYAKGEIDLGEDWKIEISDNLLDDLRNFIGEENVLINYIGLNNYILQQSNQRN